MTAGIPMTAPEDIENIEGHFNTMATSEKNKTAVTFAAGTKFENNAGPVEVPHQIVLNHKSKNIIGPGEEIKTESDLGRMGDNAPKDIKKFQQVPDGFDKDSKLAVPSNAVIVLPAKGDESGKFSLDDKTVIKTPFGDADPETVGMKMVAENADFQIVAIDKEGVGYAVSIDLGHFAQAMNEHDARDKDGKEIKLQTPYLTVENKEAFAQQFEILNGHFSDEQIAEFKQLASDMAESMKYPKEGFGLDNLKNGLDKIGDTKLLNGLPSKLTPGGN